MFRGLANLDTVPGTDEYYNNLYGNRLVNLRQRSFRDNDTVGPLPGRWGDNPRGDTLPRLPGRWGDGFQNLDLDLENLAGRWSGGIGLQNLDNLELENLWNSGIR